MQHYLHPALRALILAAALLLTGCQRNTTYILPPETTEGSLQSVPPDTTAVTAATEEMTAPYTEAVTVPIETGPDHTQTPTFPSSGKQDSHSTEPSAPAKPPNTQLPDTKPSETQPADTQPLETLPHDTQPSETLPHDTQPSETLPHDTQPQETLPHDTQPQETLPHDTQPQETLPSVYNISDHIIGTLEYEILAEVNAQRAAAGQNELKLDNTLCALAAIRAYEISISFSHTRPDGRDWNSVFSDYNFSAALSGENLLRCTSGYAPSKLVEVWMNSASHKNHILSPNFSKAGVGICYANGQMYVVNLFAG